MSLQLVVRPEAEAELLEAQVWYESRREGLGARFAATVEASMANVLAAPLAFPRIRGDIRRSLILTFPYDAEPRPRTKHLSRVAARVSTSRASQRLAALSSVPSSGSLKANGLGGDPPSGFCRARRGAGRKFDPYVEERDGRPFKRNLVSPT